MRYYNYRTNPELKIDDERENDLSKRRRRRRWSLAWRMYRHAILFFFFAHFSLFSPVQFQTIKLKSKTKLIFISL